MSNSVDKRIWVGLSATNTLLSKAIRWFTRQQPSHAWVSIWDDTLGRRMVLEAGTKMRYVPWSFWEIADQGKKVWAYTCHLDLLPATVKYARFIGTPYDYKNLFWHALRRFMGAWIRAPWRSPTRFLCSELLVRIMLEAGVPGTRGIDPEATTPGDLMNFWNDHWMFKRMQVWPSSE